MKKVLEMLSKLFAAVAVFIGVCVMGTSDVADGGFIFLFKLILLCLSFAGMSRLFKTISKTIR